MTLKQITTTNIQTHKSVVIDLPETGLVRFSGRNSNGKSVITKVTLALIRGDITKPAERHSLINKDSPYGEATWTRYDGVTLKLHLQRDSAGTYVEWIDKDGNSIKRYLSDKSWKDFVVEFGFAYNVNRDIALQMVDDESPLLFLATSDLINAEVLNTALTDDLAENAVVQFSNILSEINENLKDSSQSLQLYEGTINDFKVWDLEPLVNEVSKLESIYTFLSTIHFPYLPKLPDMTPVVYIELPQVTIPKIPDMTAVNYIDIPDVHIPKVPDMRQLEYIDVHSVKIPNIIYPPIFDIHCEIPDILPIAHDIQELKEQRCPTCGRTWV